jgi:O-antigen/teichoic acid export membrane protein
MKSWLTDKYNIILIFINKGQSRSVIAKKNIIASFIIRATSILISLILVPLTINYVNPSRYGIWLTLSSIIGWFSFFDIGLTQGLRNKFAEAKAKGDNSAAQVYLSTTFAILGIIFTLTWVIFILINPMVNWSKVLNVSHEMQTEVSLLAIIVFTFFCLSFVLKIITTILVADQQPAKSSLIDVLGQLLSLLVIMILVKFTNGSLIKLGFTYCISPLIVLFAANILLFKKDYKQYRPLFSKVDFSYAKDLFNLGLMFFVIQITGIIQFQTANIIIAQHFSTYEVTSYNIAYKYFGILNMVNVIFLTPFWSASTEAYFKNDITWIKNGIRKYSLLSAILFFVGLLMLFFSETAYSVWLGKAKVNISFPLSLWAFIYFCSMIFGSKYVYFLNSINALRIQFIACLISPAIYILLAVVFINNLHMGVFAVLIASVIANFNGIILAPLQYHQVINRHKKGIWIK